MCDQQSDGHVMVIETVLPIMSVCVACRALVMDVEHLSDMFLPRPSST